MMNTNSQAEASLAKELLFFRTLLNNAHEAILVVQDNKIVFHNKRLLDFTGFDAIELTKIRASELIFPADKELLEEGFRLIRSKQVESYVFTFRMLNKRNEIRWMESKIAGISFQDQPAAIFYIYDISENKEAEEAVNVSIDFLNTLIDTIPNPMFYRNLRGEFIGCNNSFVNFIGKPKKKIIGQTCYDFLPKETANELHQLNLNVMKEQGYQVHETKIPHADGSLHDVISYNATFYLADQSVGGVVGILTDISEQKLVEEQLRTSEFRYKQLVKNLNVGIIVFNPRHNGTRFMIAEMNLAGEKILAVNRERANGLSMTEFFGYNHAQELYQVMRQVWETGTGKSFLQKKPTQDNSEQLLQHFIYKVPSGDLVSIFNDITASQQTQTELVQSEEKYRFLVENSSDVILKMDRNLDLLFVSPAFGKVFGKGTHYAANDNFLQYVPSVEREAVHLQLLNLFENNCKGTFEHQVIKSSGLLWFSWSLKVVSIQGQEEPLLVAIGHDISIHKATEAQLLLAKQKAEDSDRLKSAFVANMSHEIRTPLNAIIGSSELLAAHQLNENETSEHINYIISSGKNLLNLINEIIDSAKMEAGHLAINKVDFNLNQMLTEIYGTFTNQAQLNMAVEFRVQRLVEYQDLVIKTDPYRIKQILCNLLSNAFKFTDKGFIELRYQLNKRTDNTHEIEFVVQDTGIGIPDNKFEQIFKRFGQVEDYNHRNQKGTGLGLAISKQLVELLGGYLNLESKIGKGSSFSFRMVVDTHIQKVTKEETSTIEPIYDWHDKTILIAEDNRINYMILQKSLSRTNVKVIWAKDGEEAVEMFANNTIDLVLMDIQMPKLNGYEATAALKKINPKIPIIAQTASALYEDQQKVLDAGCDAYISKPIHTAQLYPLIQKLLTN